MHLWRRLPGIVIISLLIVIGSTALHLPDSRIQAEFNEKYQIFVALIAVKTHVNIASTPVITATATARPTATPSLEVTLTPTQSPSATQTSSPTPSPSHTLTPSQSPTLSPTLTITPTPTATQTASPTTTPSRTLTPSPTPTLSPSPTTTPSPTATQTATPYLHETLTVAWRTLNEGWAAQTHPAIAYNPDSDRLFLAWEDGRNDPGNHVDTYGFADNSDIFARQFDSNGVHIGDEIPIANDGQYLEEERYDNEQWPAVTYAHDDFEISWMTITDDTLELGDLKTSSCYDIAARTYTETTNLVGPKSPDLAGYTAPPSLIDPWGNRYDWSCQHEPESHAVGDGAFVHIWHDHRERFEPAGDNWASKDIYAQLRRDGDILIRGGLLVSHDTDQERLPYHQENPDIAGTESQMLVVWEDERHTDADYPDKTGYRDVYGRFLYWHDSTLTTGSEIELALGMNGDYALSHPSVGYMPHRDLYVIFWSKRTDPAVLEYTVIASNGERLHGPALIPDTSATVSHVHDIACSQDHCVIVYRKGDDTRNMYVNSMSASDFQFDNEIRISAERGHHTYPKIQFGERVGDATQFYTAYVVGNTVAIARLDVRPLELTATPTPTPQVGR
ncbi:MAG: hypothetical protein GY759_10310 [Chloroflexi bacterium]|nr:hypothetical protein [Chloroflexota bacterium]